MICERRLAVLILLLVCGAGGRAAGQVISGRISGTAVDPSGAAIPAAAVALVNEATRASRETVAEQTGYSREGSCCIFSALR
ncbi:MAG: hypothetical protein FJW37_06625 [Acidobacteria bacterium]|nr:hypothetical protein [Acidobacteriota bacterium]